MSSREEPKADNCQDGLVFMGGFGTLAWRGTDFPAPRGPFPRGRRGRGRAGRGELVTSRGRVANSPAAVSPCAPSACVACGRRVCHLATLAGRPGGRRRQRGPGGPLPANGPILLPPGPL